MDESPDGDETDAMGPEATDEDVEAAVTDVEAGDGRVEEPDEASVDEGPSDDGGSDALAPGDRAPDGSRPEQGVEEGPGRADAPGGRSPPDGESDLASGDLPDEVLNASTGAEAGEHTLLEEYERENESRWKALARQGAFWVGATAVTVAVTLTAVVSLRQSGLSDGLAFILASVGMAVMVGFVFLSLRR